MIRKYEMLFLLNSKIEIENLKKLKKDLETKISGKIVKKEDWGIKPLSYDIKKQKEAIYILYYVETENNNVDIVKNYCFLNKSIIRNLILRHDKKWPFEMKTTKDIVFPERNKYVKKPIFKDGKRPFKKK